MIRRRAELRHRRHPRTPILSLYILESNTTAAGSGIELCFEPGIVEAGKQSTDEIEIHAADELGVLVGEGVERAVDQRHSVRIDARLVARVLQDPDGCLAYRRATLDRAFLTTDLPSERPSSSAVRLQRL